jgi:hypothetical protein
LKLNDYNLKLLFKKLKEILEEDVEKEYVNSQWFSLKNKAKINNNKLYRTKLNNKQNQYIKLLLQ